MLGGILRSGRTLAVTMWVGLFGSGCLVSQYRLYDGPPQAAAQVALLQISNDLVKKDEKLAIVCKIDSVPGSNTAGSIRGCSGVTPGNTCFNDTGLSWSGLGFTAELTPGPHKLVVVPANTEFAMPDTISFEAKPGRRYTVRIAVQWDDGSSFSLGGATGKWRAEVVDLGPNDARK